MKKNAFGIIFLCLFMGPLRSETVYTDSDPYVTVRLEGRLGNIFFQIATAYAYSLDHEIPLTIPDLAHQGAYNIRYHGDRLFAGKIDRRDVSGAPVIWKEPHYYYSKIPNEKQIELRGYFTSEKYFKHRRKEILELFAPEAGLLDKILQKYPVLGTEELTVAIQIRDYRPEFPEGYHHPTFGREFYEKAVAHFPPDTIFFVTSDNMTFARECTEGLRRNLIYLDSGDYIEDFYTLTLCKSFIISNSTFGWWAAWLSTAENKKVIAPKPWLAYPYNNLTTFDVLPRGTVVIRSKPIIEPKKG